MNRIAYIILSVVVLFKFGQKQNTHETASSTLMVNEEL